MFGGSSAMTGVARAGLAAGSIVVNGLELFGGVGQMMELKMAQEHHEIDMRFSRIDYHQSKQNLRLDALDHAKEEVRSHYDTYVGRIDTLLLVLALIWPFALNTIQFSDPFVPGDEGDCDDSGPGCIEVEYRIIVHIWVALLAVILVLPFWGILCLIRVKLKLDGWLEYSLAGLKKERRGIVKAMAEPIRSGEPVPDKADELVQKLVVKVSKYQDFLADIWNRECTMLVHAAHSLLWMSAYAALALTSISVWVFLWNKGDAHRRASLPFAVIIVTGCVVPLGFVFYQQHLGDTEPPDIGVDDSRSKFPLASPSALQCTHNLRRYSGRLRRQTSPLSANELLLHASSPENMSETRPFASGVNNNRSDYRSN